MSSTMRLRSQNNSAAAVMNCTYYFSILSVQPASYIWRHVSVDVPIGFISFFNALRLRAVVVAHYHQLLYVEKQQNKTKHRLTYYPRIETFMLKQILCWAKFWQFFKDPWTLIPCNVPLFIAFSVGHRTQNCIARLILKNREQKLTT